MWRQVDMTIRAVTLLLLASLCMAEPSHAGEMPFKLATPLELDLKYKGHGRTAVFAASSLPYLMVEENGGVYWLLNMETLESRVAVDNGAAGIDHLVGASRW